MMCGTCRCFLGASLSQSHRQAKAATQPMPLFKRGFLHVCMLCHVLQGAEMLRFASLRSGHFSDRDGLRSFLLRCILITAVFLHPKSNVL